MRGLLCFGLMKRRDPIFKIYADNLHAYISGDSAKFSKINQDDDLLEEMEFDAV